MALDSVGLTTEGEEEEESEESGVTSRETEDPAAGRCWPSAAGEGGRIE